MKTPLITIEDYLVAASVFHWAYMSHYVRWFTGKSVRHQRTEKVLKRLAKRGKLKTMLFGKKLIYAKKTGLINELAIHGLACTECLVRFYRSKTDGVAIPEKYFRGLGSVPEWGIIYPSGTILLFEFSTKSNFYYSGLMRGKLAAYDRNIEKIEAKFNCKAVVVFVLDIPRSAVERYVGSLGGVPPRYEGGVPPLTPMFFTDYETFLRVPLGEALQTPIYFYTDGKEHSLA